MITKMPKSRNYSNLAKYMGEDEEAYKAQMEKLTEEFNKKYPKKPVNAKYIALSAIYRASAHKVLATRLMKATPDLKLTGEGLKNSLEQEYGIKNVDIKDMTKLADEYYGAQN